jgi:AcrR family transcriptional regulator
MARRSDHSRNELTRLALDAARKIVQKQGLRGLSTRQIGTRIGYSPGTLYQLFADLDELVMRMNAETLDRLIADCREVDFSGSPEAVLEELGRRYIAAVKSEPALWNAVFEHSLPDGKETPQWMSERTWTLLGFAQQAIAPLFRDGEEALCRHQVLVLWAGLYGIASLAASGKLPTDEPPEALVQTLVRNTMTALRARLQN